MLKDPWRCKPALISSVTVGVQLSLSETCKQLVQFLLWINIPIMLLWQSRLHLSISSCCFPLFLMGNEAIQSSLSSYLCYSLVMMLYSGCWALTPDEVRTMCDMVYLSKTWGRGPCEAECAVTVSNKGASNLEAHIVTLTESLYTVYIDKKCLSQMSRIKDSFSVDHEYLQHFLWQLWTKEVVGWVDWPQWYLCEK